jgi:hypothetical protein
MLESANGADREVELLDRELSEEPAGCRASQIESALRRKISNNIDVVIKDRTFENWLIACPDSYSKQRGRFPHHEVVKRKVPDGQADGYGSPEDLINEACPQRRRYDKVADSERILKLASVEEIARNSRSFRRFLAVLGDKTYRQSSKVYIEVTVPTTSDQPASRRPKKKT